MEVSSEWWHWTVFSMSLYLSVVCIISSNFSSDGRGNVADLFFGTSMAGCAGALAFKIWG